MANSKPLNCPCCGSAATVEPHLIEAGLTVGDKTWADWWTASVNCDSCALQFVAGGDTEEEAVRNAVEGWNRRCVTQGSGEELVELAHGAWSMALCAMQGMPIPAEWGERVESGLREHGIDVDDEKAAFEEDEDEW